MEWYYVKGEDRVGPLDDAAFQALVQAGDIQAETLVWNPTLANWKPLREVGATTAGAAAELAQATCAVCGGSFPLQDVARFGEQYVCAGCKPQFVQSVKEGTTESLVATYAGFWTRFGASFLDGIILWVVNSTLQLAVTFGIGSSASAGAGIALMVIVMFLQFGIGASYETYMIGKYGATLGKMAAKIRVVNADGSKVTYGRAFGRYFAKIVSALILYIGFIMAAFDKEKRALHDHMCSTRVVKQ